MNDTELIASSLVCLVAGLNLLTPEMQGWLFGKRFRYKPKHVAAPPVPTAEAEPVMLGLPFPGRPWVRPETEAVQHGLRVIQ